MSSPSTLIRKARLAESRGHTGAAKRLRADAAKLRRAQRNKAKAPKKSKNMKVLEQALLNEQRRSLLDEVVGRNLIEGHGADASSPLEQAVDRVLGPQSTIEQRIGMRRELLEARKTGENNAAAMYAGNLKAQVEASNISIVCGFMAIIELAQAANKGSLPPTMSLAGYTAAKVYDALRHAGYTRDGLNGGGIARENIHARWTGKEIERVV